VSALTTRRHFALRHHLHPDEAAEAATAAWVSQRTRHYAALARVAVTPVTDAEEYQARTGRRISERCWGDADWSAEPLVYVDPAKCVTKGQAEVVIAHEVGHHAWKSYRHRPLFWVRVQELLDCSWGPDQGAAE
jgi:hypothetical protein